jgi:hypothetical protein
MLDGIEDQRALSIMEQNFRRILKKHTSKLLDAKIIYWKKQSKKSNGANLVIKNSKFFHTVATQSYMKNLITSIKQDDGNYITNHDHKATIIWNSYKERLGITDNPIMAYDLDNLVNRLDLLHLDESFTQEEIDSVIKEIPTVVSLL